MYLANLAESEILNQISAHSPTTCVGVGLAAGAVGFPFTTASTFAVCAPRTPLVAAAAVATPLAATLTVLGPLAATSLAPHRNRSKSKLSKLRSCSFMVPDSSWSKIQTFALACWDQKGNESSFPAVSHVLDLQFGQLGQWFNDLDLHQGQLVE